MTTDELPKPVTAAIDAVYLEFHKYPFNRDMEDAYGLADNTVFATRCLRQLSVEDFGSYLTKAISSWGTVDDFKHFLPRLLELFAQKSFKLSKIDPFLVIVKLDSAEWLRWPELERLSVCYLFEVLMEMLLNRSYAYQYDSNAFQFLRQIAGIVADVSPYLKRADEIRSEGANEQLARFFLWEKDKLLANNKITLYAAGHFRDQTPQAQQLVAWLHRRTIRDRLEQAFFNCQQPELAKIYSDAVYWHDLWTSIERRDCNRISSRLPY